MLRWPIDSTSLLKDRFRVNQDQSSANAGTWMALIALLFVGAGLLGIIFVVLPDIILLVSVVLGFALIVFLHYITWGVWLTRASQKWDDDESRSSNGD